MRIYEIFNRKYRLDLKSKKSKNSQIGIVYHIPSSNILLMPFYTWIPSFLCGNNNFIRLSNSIQKKEIENLVNLLDDISWTRIINIADIFEDTSENIKSELVSFNCDARIMWGNDQTINEYKKKSEIKCDC